MPVNINCYISTPGIQGLDIHYDRHDVFILHLEGIKTWKVFHPTVVDPTEKLKYKLKTPPVNIEPYLEVELQPGDVLYVPRGHWHYAVSDEVCYHLTVGWQARTFEHFMAWWAGKLRENNPEWRENLNIVDCQAFGGERASIFEESVDNLEEKIQSCLKNGALKALVMEYVMESNVLNRNPVTYLPTQQLTHSLVTAETSFALPIGQKIILNYDSENLRGKVIARGETVTLENISERLLIPIFHSDWPISGNSVLQACPEITWDELKNIFLQLLDSGVVVIV
jgi:ribosomal protein L16 Arg81 hydroxylase